MRTCRIHVTGTVQGVGFRPFIYAQAKKISLNGSVNNDSNGVEIFVTGSSRSITSFIDQIKSQSPPLSKIDSILVNDRKEIIYFDDFKIIDSRSQSNISTIIPPDISICDECRDELFDPINRRFEYPFITCTNCGPRYTIIKTLPYDRPYTSMDKFTMCTECRKEYENPLNRRYHAQPIGCFDCGPKIELLNNKQVIATEKDSVEQLVDKLSSGKIAALKGVGGYHLICDATNNESVKLLRLRKKRPAKPFAVMVSNIAQARTLVNINKKQEKILVSGSRPIVLATKEANLPLSSLVAPDVPEIGIMLAYSPLHILILEKLGVPIIATSANISDQPLCTNRDEICKINYIWDVCLEHDRDIVNGCDDSVSAVVNNQPLTFRRARGYAPGNIKLPFKLNKKILTVGANQKNCIAIAFDDNAVLSPHIGDLNTIESIEYFKKSISDLKRIYNFVPDIIVCDKHPNYEPTKWAYQQVASGSNKPVIIEAQHHHAHIMAVLIEHKIKEDVLGIAFDGTGYGDDGNIWGGEFFLSSLKGSKRIGHFKYFKLLGGDQAIKEPRRVALSLLIDCFGENALNLNCPTNESFSKNEISTLFTAFQNNLNSPLTSSCGRLFDAVASLAGICQKQSYEGQTGLLMENYYNKNVTQSYGYSVDNYGVIDFDQMIRDILKDSDPSIIISKFFNTLVEIVYLYYKKHKLKLVISGGVFQNKVLTELILEKIPDVIIPTKLPTNDGGIAIGQLAAAINY